MQITFDEYYLSTADEDAFAAALKKANKDYHAKCDVIDINRGMREMVVQLIRGDNNVYLRMQKSDRE